MRRSDRDHPVGGILAGGENRRMNGFPKGALQYRGSSFFECVYRAVSSVVDEMFVSIHRERPEGVPPDVCCVRDRFTGIRASMNGLYSLLHTLGRPVLVVPWDMPRVDAVVLKLLLLRWRSRPDSTGAVHLERRGRTVPFPGIYHPGLGPSLHQRLKTGHYSIRSLLNDCATRSLTADELNRHPRFSPDRLLVNVNDPDDLDRLEDSS